MENRVLERVMFSEPEAARLLRVPRSTLRWWLEGGERRGRRYPPVIRATPTGSHQVTWGEFVEAGLLRQYRRAHAVALAELRAFIDVARTEFGVPHPLAHQRPFVGAGRRLLVRLQDEVSLTGGLHLVAVAGGQLVLTPAAEAFFDRVEWGDGVAVAWRPHDDPASPVRMRPDQRFGLPSVAGVKTEVVWEQVEAGAGFDEVASDLGITEVDARWAWSYENSAHAVAA